MQSKIFTTFATAHVHQSHDWSCPIVECFSHTLCVRACGQSLRVCVWPVTACLCVCVFAHVPACVRARACVSLGFRFVPNMGLVKERGPNLFLRFSGSCTNSRLNLLQKSQSVNSCFRPLIVKFYRDERSSSFCCLCLLHSSGTQPSVTSQRALITFSGK